MRDYQALLADTAVRGSERESLTAKLERVTKQCEAWNERCEVLKEIVVSVEAQVKDVCDRKCSTMLCSVLNGINPH
jgi:signal recognition particle GTPase